jgi:hypothetical protein
MFSHKFSLFRIKCSTEFARLKGVSERPEHSVKMEKFGQLFCNVSLTGNVFFSIESERDQKTQEEATLPLATQPSTPSPMALASTHGPALLGEGLMLSCIFLYLC